MPYSDFTVMVNTHLTDKDDLEEEYIIEEMVKAVKGIQGPGVLRTLFPKTKEGRYSARLEGWTPEKGKSKGSYHIHFNLSLEHPGIKLSDAEGNTTGRFKKYFDEAFPWDKKCHCWVKLLDSSRIKNYNQKKAARAVRSVKVGDKKGNRDGGTITKGDGGYDSAANQRKAKEDDAGVSR